MKDLLVLILGMVLSIILFGGGIGLAANVLSKNQCLNYQQITAQEVKYISFDTCYVKTPKGWMRWDEYIARSTTNE